MLEDKFSRRSVLNSIVVGVGRVPPETGLYGGGPGGSTRPQIQRERRRTHNLCWTAREPCPCDLAREAQRVERLWVVLLDAGRQNVAFPRTGGHLHPVELCDDGPKAFRS